MNIPVPVLAADPYRYWHYLINTSTGRHKKMPVLVLARVTKGKIPVWASSEYASTSIGSRSVLVLVLAKNMNASTGTNVTQMWQYRYWKICTLPIVTKVGKIYFGPRIFGQTLEKKVNTSSSSLGYQYRKCAAPYQYW